MPRRSLRRLVALASLAMVLGTLVAGQARAGSDATGLGGANGARQAARWAGLGPPGPQAIAALAVAPDWPAQATVLAARRGPAADQQDLVRSLNGGRTWERLPAPAERVAALVLAPRALDGQTGPNARVAFALASGGWYRSPDAGATWQKVLAMDDDATGADLVLSPDFARDGLAFVVAGGQLYRGRDGGLSWQPLQPAPGQRVQQLVFSPAFAQDRTLFLSAVSGDFAPFSLDRPQDGPADDHVQSRGVLVSTDAGASWAETAGTLALDGVPYRHVQRLAISPTYAVDRTLLAFAWGPRTPAPFMGGSTARQWRGALFRSPDGGQSWTVVRPFEPQFVRVRAALALSPTFSTDGIALVAFSSASLSPASSNCAVERSTDGGTTWTRVLAPGSYEACGAPRLFALAGAPRELGALVAKGPGWQHSADGGLSWQGLQPPDGTWAPGVLPAVGADGTILVGASYGGVWAYGRTVEATGGSLPCATPLAGGFGRVWDTEPWARARLGCPLGPEQPRPIRVRDLAGGRGYWVDDEGTDWYEVGERAWDARAKPDRPWPPGNDQHLDGAVQYFEGGVLLWLPFPDGRRVILALARPDQAWREVPD